MDAIFEILRLFLGSIIYRPYVYAFFACFLFFAVYQLGWGRALTFLVSTFFVAYGSEYSSTRNGFPFGPYSYIDVTRTRELWISNVPFWDSLSFVFLSYFSFTMAAALLTPVGGLRGAPWSGVRSRGAPYVGGFIMMLLDVVIDPVTLQGNKWFLGQVYSYPYKGFYFGVTFANFLGWFFVGFMSQWLFQRCLELLPWCRAPRWRIVPRRFIWGVFLVYAGIFAFNFAITVFIRDYRLAGASAVVSGLTLLVIVYGLGRRGITLRSQWD